MPTIPSGRYQLKSLHEEIDLFDRKLAHLQKYETFATEAERNASLEKLSAKRNLLVRKAQKMIDEGVEFQERERPQSLRPKGEKTHTDTSHPIVEKVAPEPAPAAETQSTSYAGSFFDIQQAVEEYKKNRSRHGTV